MASEDILSSLHNTWKFWCDNKIIQRVYWQPQQPQGNPADDKNKGAIPEVNKSTLKYLKYEGTFSQIEKGLEFWNLKAPWKFIKRGSSRDETALDQQKD